MVFRRRREKLTHPTLYWSTLWNVMQSATWKEGEVQEILLLQKIIQRKSPCMHAYDCNNLVFVHFCLFVCLFGTCLAFPMWSSNYWKKHVQNLIRSIEFQLRVFKTGIIYFSHDVDCIITENEANNLELSFQNSRWLAKLFIKIHWGPTWRPLSSCTMIK